MVGRTPVHFFHVKKQKLPSQGLICSNIWDLKNGILEAPSTFTYFIYTKIGPLRLANVKNTQMGHVPPITPPG